MEVLQFIRERQRMCRFYSHDAGDCYQCPAKDCECSVLEDMVDDNRIVAIVEKWSKENTNTPKTRQSEFLKLFPEADVCKTDGCLTLNPCEFYQEMYKKCSAKSHCSECRHKFWMQELK